MSPVRFATSCGATSLKDRACVGASVEKVGRCGDRPRWKDAIEWLTVVALSPSSFFGVIRCLGLALNVLMIAAANCIHRCPGRYRHPGRFSLFVG